MLSGLLLCYNALMKAGKDYIGVITPFFCHDGYGDFLFYRRSEKTKDNHGIWDCSGGSMQFGEQPEQTMRRKLRSQYGVEPVRFIELPAHSVLIEIDEVDNHWLAIPFIVQVNRKEVVIGEADKMRVVAWFNLDELPRPLHPGAADILAVFRDKFISFASSSS